MNPMLTRAAVGVVVMLVTCGLTFAIGNRSMRWAAGLIFVCWALAVALEFAIGPHVEILIVANVVNGLGLLVLAVLDGAAWLWIMVALQAAVFLLHALTFGGHQPSRREVIGNNTLITLGLIVMVAAAIMRRLEAGRSWSRPRRRAF